MRRVVLLLLAGCNAVFGVKDTRQYDAAYFDAGLDAPFACPAPGGTPMFSPNLHQDVIETCQSYRERAGTVVAACLDPTMQLYRNVVGQLHTTLDQDHGLPQADYTVGVYYDSLRLSSDGTRVYLRHYTTDGSYAFDEWDVDSTGTWSFARNVVSSQVYLVLYDTFADRLLISDDTYLGYNEVHLDGTLGYDHKAAELGLMSVLVFSVSSDGLRAVVVGLEASATTSSVYYTDRTALDTPFSPVRKLANVPSLQELSTTDDCARIYFPALGSILYLQQD